MREAQPPSLTDAPSASTTLATPPERGTQDGRAKSAEGNQRTRSKSRRSTYREGVESRDAAGDVTDKAGAKPVEGRQRDQPYSRYATNDVDYEKKYPPDPYGEELSEKARVWSVYNEEAQMADAEMVRGMNGTLDVLLVFAGLFSAVVTTFVAQSSQSLATDYAQITASLMYEFIRMQRAIANGTPAGDVPVSQLSFGSKTSGNTDVWVNGLWFTSLAFSLLTALISVLAKQWIQNFNSMTTDTPRDRALLRQYRLQSFKRWNVPFIVAFLHNLLILALFLFFAGLAVYVAPLNRAIFWAIVGFSAIGFLAYVLTSVLPIIAVHCAYKTPISDYILAFCYLLPYIYHSMGYLVRWLYLGLRVIFVAKDSESYWQLCLRRVMLVRIPYRTITLKQREMSDVERHRDSLTPESLFWLGFSSSGVSAAHIAAQAASAIPLNYKQPFQWRSQMLDLGRDVLETLARECAASKELVTQTAHLSERLGRAALHDSSLHSFKQDLQLWDDLYTCRDQIMSPQLDALLCIVVLRRWYTSFSEASTMKSSEGALSTADISILLPPTSDVELHPNVWSELISWAQWTAHQVLPSAPESFQDPAATRRFVSSLHSLMSTMWIAMDRQTPLVHGKPPRSLSSFDNTALSFDEYYRAWCAELEEKEVAYEKELFEKRMDGLQQYLDTWPIGKPSAEATSVLPAIRDSADSKTAQPTAPSSTNEPAAPSSAECPPDERLSPSFKNADNRA